MRRMIPDNKWKEVKNATEPLSFDSANRVLTVDSDLQMTGDIKVADPDEQSVKKIYCHPIAINRTSVSNITCRLTMLIFNNTPTAFTMTALQSFLVDIAPNSGKLLVSGAYYNGDSQQTFIASYLSYNTVDEYFYLTGIDVSDGSGVYKRGTSLQAIFATEAIEDGVNPIN